MPSRNTHHLTWVSLTLDVEVSLHSCSNKTQPLLLTLDEGYLLAAAPPDLELGVAPLSPPVPEQPPLLGCNVARPGCRAWPQTWGSSSWPILSTAFKLSCCVAISLRLKDKNILCD